MDIRLLSFKDIDLFFDHRERSALESGKKGTPIFMVPPHFPLPRKKEDLLKHWRASFNGTRWQRNWGAFGGERIVGNMELSSHAHLRHRALFSLAIEHDYRHLGLGKKFLDIALTFLSENKFDWIDGNVFSTNTPSLSFFKKHNFQETGVVKDKYRIQGVQIDYHLFSKQINRVS